jgi:DNA primase
VTADWVALKQQVKEASDIVAVVGGYLTLRPAGPTFKGLCPFHDDTRPSFDVDPRRQRYRCWACNKFGDVISFVQEFERVSFQEALELLARRAGISLENLSRKPPGPSRTSMLDVMRWAGEQFAQCLLDAPLAEAARKYLGERKLAGETVRRFGLGFAPATGDWLVQKATAATMSIDLLETVGLIAARGEGRGHYDRFRDRVMFPIRDARGQTVGFGGRILPGSPLAERAPKYYNSAETPLFSKSDQLYGIDQAWPAAKKAGYLAIVEGYTDVLMAHQCGVANVVATMGTALNARHVRKLRDVGQRVVLVFDADAGGDTGVDRALDVFVRHEIDLRIATLPAGLDPCDLLTRPDGAETFRRILETAADVFEYKLNRVWSAEANNGVEGQRRAAEQVLAVLARSPEERSLKLELMVNRIAHRLSLKEETVWTRLRELRAARPADREPARPREAAAPEEPAEERRAPAARHEVRLLEVLLANPALVGTARAEVNPTDVEHPGLRQLLECLYRLQAEGLQPDLDHVQDRLHNERLLEKARQFQDRGVQYVDGAAELHDVLGRFRDRRGAGLKQALREAVEAGDRARAEDLQRQINALTRRPPPAGS